MDNGIPHICHFFTHAKFLENKIYTETLHRAIFFTQATPVVPVTNMRYVMMMMMMAVMMLMPMVVRVLVMVMIDDCLFLLTRLYFKAITHCFK